jgi:hypothetical protein
VAGGLDRHGRLRREAAVARRIGASRGQGPVGPDDLARSLAALGWRASVEAFGPFYWGTARR